MYSPSSLTFPSFPCTMMSDNLTQEDTNRVMIEGIVHFLLLELLPQLRSAPGP